MFKLERLFKPNMLLPFIFTALHLSECSEFRFWQDLRTIIMQQVLDRKKNNDETIDWIWNYSSVSEEYGVIHKWLLALIKMRFSEYLRINRKR